MLTRREFVTGASLAVVAGSGGALAQAYPSQTIRILAGFPAGGGIDLLARILAEPLKALGQPVVVENRTGAAGMIAAQATAKAPPDGHTMLMATSGEIAISHHLYKEKMAYDPMRELAPVALAGIVPCVVVVADTAPVKTPQELIAYAKANPQKLSFSSSGVGNPQQLAGELMNSMAGTDVLHVPYRGAAPAVTDVATGAVTMSFSSYAAALPLIQAGKIRAVAVTSLERMPQLPDVAPLQEGAPGLKGRRIRARRHASADRNAAQRDHGQDLHRAGNGEKALRSRHRAARDHARAVQDVRGGGEQEVRRDHRAGQHQGARLGR
jgi:tripartite-type tricarboxylate transporter receptor subunit TctC